MPASDALGMAVLMMVSMALALIGMITVWLSAAPAQRARMRWRPLMACLLIGVCLIIALLSGSF